MNCKKITISVLLLIMLSLTLTRSTIAEPTSEGTQTRVVYSLRYIGLTVEVEAPYQTDPGEDINVTVRVGAYVKGVYVEHISLGIYGLKNETDKIALGEGTIPIADLEGPYALNETREYVYNITIPEELLPGLTYGTITCEWTVMEGEVSRKIPSAGFIVTYVGNKEFEQLQTAYEELNASYWELNSNYTELNSTYTELEEKYSASSGEIAGTRNLMYAFIATTVVSAATAIFLVIRRPKERWE